MTGIPLLCALFTLSAVVALLVAEHRDLRAGVWLAKPAAAAGFIATAWTAGAADSAYGRVVLVALALCFLGDVLLIARDSRGAFLAGLASFLLGHLAFAVAFGVRGIETAGLAVGAPVMAVFAVVCLRWLWPQLPAAMKPPVSAYVSVISGMAALAAGTAAAAPAVGIAAGAVLFAVSDLFVARERFVVRSFTNKLLGLPLYFGAQLLLAASVTSPGGMP